MSRRALPATPLLLLSIFAGGATACAPDPEAGAGEARPAAAAGASSWRASDPPAGPGAMAPNLTAAGEDLLLTWLEPVGPAEEPTGHRLQLARFAGGPGGRWSEPSTIASGPGFFANWADFPAVAQAPDGSLTAHWLAKTGEDTYAYGIFLAHSADGGRTWSETGMLHDDGIPAEHGFVSWVPEGQGLRAFWLDGRNMPEGGPMTVRTARVENGRAQPGELVDERVCDCCQTDAAVAAGGPVVAYRDRTADEIRDIYTVRRTAAGWSEPVRVAADDWKIPGCPVNGPAVAASGDRVAVAWFTAAPPSPKVQLAVSQDGGATFGEPILIDGEKPLGRVDLVIDEKTGDALVSWMAMEGDNAAIRLRRVPFAGASGRQGAAGEPLTVAATSAARGSGFPRAAWLDGRLYLAFVEEGEGGRRVRVGSLAP